jgi:hypothetical protein
MSGAALLTEVQNNTVVKSDEKDTILAINDCLKRVTMRKEGIDSSSLLLSTKGPAQPDIKYTKLLFSAS